MIGYLIGASLVSFVIGKCCSKTKIVEVEKKPKRKTTATPKTKEPKKKITKTELKKKYIEQYGENFKKLLNAKYIVAFPYHQKWKNKGEKQEKYYPRIIFSDKPLTAKIIFDNSTPIGYYNVIHSEEKGIETYLKALEDLGYKLSVMNDWHDETENCYFKKIVFIKNK